MSDVMMRALQMQVESLTRQVETLGPENERVRKLLTEFSDRHDRDQSSIEDLQCRIKGYRNETMRAFVYARDARPAHFPTAITKIEEILEATLKKGE